MSRHLTKKLWHQIVFLIDVRKNHKIRMLFEITAGTCTIVPPLLPPYPRRYRGGEGYLSFYQLKYLPISNMEADFRVSKANIYCIVNAWGGIAVHALGTILGCILRFYEKAYGECVEIGTNRISFDGVILNGSTWKYHSICCGQTIHMNMISFFFTDLLHCIIWT